MFKLSGSDTRAVHASRPAGNVSERSKTDERGAFGLVDRVAICQMGPDSNLGKAMILHRKLAALAVALLIQSPVAAWAQTAPSRPTSTAPIAAEASLGHAAMKGVT